MIMKPIVLFEASWGNLLLDADFKEIDLLPRLTVSEILCFGTIIHAGFLMLSLNLTVFDPYAKKMIEDMRKDKGGSRDTL